MIPPKPPATGTAISVCSSLRVMDVVDIDTINETFTITCELLLEWAAPESESLHGDNGLEEGVDRRDKDWEPEWWPSWEVFGLSGDLENVRREFWTRKGGDNGGKQGFRVSNSTTFTAKIVEKMDLEEFPFDVEDLTVNLRLTNEITEAYFVNFDNEERYPIVDMRDADVSLSEYFPYPDIPYNFKLMRKSARGEDRSTILLQINMVRSQQYYFYNIISIMLLLTTSVAVSWTMDPAAHDVQGSRVSFDLNLILAGIAFKFVLAGMLPHVSYMTTLDAYIFSCFLTLFLVMFWHALQGAVPRLSEEDVDRWSLVIVLLLWFSVNVRFALYAVRSIAIRKREIEEQTQPDDVVTGKSLRGLRIKKNRSERLMEWAQTLGGGGKVD